MNKPPVDTVRCLLLILLLLSLLKDLQGYLTGGLAVGHLGGSAGQLAVWEESPAGGEFQLWVAVLASPSLGWRLAAIHRGPHGHQFIKGQLLSEREFR